MLSTDIKQELTVKRIEKVVSILMEEYHLFKEELNYSEMVKLLVNIAQENLTFEHFKSIPDNDLKKRCRGVMSVEILSKIGENFTPEEMAIFDDAVKRK